MSAKKQKYYVVWKGHEPGIYKSWDKCKAQIKDFKGAQYKAFYSMEEAQEALKKSFNDYKGKSVSKRLSMEQIRKIGKPNMHSICVDAAVSGNPGKMEYRGVDTFTKKQLFKQGPFEEGTNNIGEFLAIVHGLAYLKKRNSDRIIYTDSKIAMGWVRKGKCNTKLKQGSKNSDLFELIQRAEQWLKDHKYNTVIVKWETLAWGEIPADFGRK